MKQEPLKGLLQGDVMVDETYVGGVPRKYGRKDGRRKVSLPNTPRVGRGTAKTPVMALVERDGRVRAHVVPNVTARVLKKSIRELVDPSATIMTDDYTSYRGIGRDFAGGHLTVNHSGGEYVRTVKGKKVTTNEAEAFFALLKRGITGSFHSVSKKHLNRYCDEFSFRWSLRKLEDADRTFRAIVASEGKRLIYKTPVADIMSAAL
jgi:transposase-like protein